MEPCRGESCVAHGLPPNTVLTSLRVWLVMPFALFSGAAFARTRIFRTLASAATANGITGYRKGTALCSRSRYTVFPQPLSPQPLQCVHPQGDPGDMP